MNLSDASALRSFLEESPRNRDIFRKIPLPTAGENPMQSRRPISESVNSKATELWNIVVSVGQEDADAALSIKLAATSLIMDSKPAVTRQDVDFIQGLAANALKSSSSKCLITDAHIVLSIIGLITQDLKIATINATLALNDPDSYFEDDARISHLRVSETVSNGSCRS